jgi:cyclopropane fatty-acyl-phospholipid synthase-like methyltransferase
MSYMKNYGDVMQAYRPNNKEELLDYIARSAGINWGLKVLDMGCGIAGPAIYFAKKWNVFVDGLTISNIQCDIANEKIDEDRLGSKIKVYDMDFHILNDDLIWDNEYDIVIFLESLGHSNNIMAALSQAYKKLKKGGILYIKDFYKKKPKEQLEKQLIDNIINNINENYYYHTLDLEILKSTLESIGFKIKFIRPFEFIDDISCRERFENENKIDIFEGNAVNPADWLEIKCIKLDN